MFKNLISEAVLRQELEALKAEVKELRNQQIKRDRDMEDLIYNLDGDNIPQLEGIVKRVNLIVSGDGTAKAEFLIDAINGSSKVKIKADAIDLNGNILVEKINDTTGVTIKADAIDLSGKEINLTSDQIQIESENFRVDADGNMECGNAKIRGSSTICSDIAPGEEGEVAMSIGPEIEFDMGESKTVSGTKMRVTDYEDVLGDPTYTRRVAFVSSIDRNIGSEARKTIHGGVVSDPRLAGAFMSHDESHTMRPDYDQAFVGLERPALENDGIRAILRVGEHALWLDAFGVLRTTASEIVFEDEL
jgi:hypothetical protein